MKCFNLYPCNDSSKIKFKNSIVLQAFLQKRKMCNRLAKHYTCILHKYFYFTMSQRRLGHNEIRRPWWLMQICMHLVPKLMCLFFEVGQKSSQATNIRYSDLLVRAVFSILPQATKVDSCLDSSWYTLNILAKQFRLRI